MRLLLKLKALENFSYDFSYYHKLQGFIYNSLKPYYSQLHDKKGYKFFCFSNLFPLGDVKEGKKRNLLISSPNSALIKILQENLPEKINLGEMLFQVEEKKLLNLKLPSSSSLKIISATPIVIRIPEKNYERYQIPENKRKRNYLYWRPEYSFNAFIKQLEGNLFKKYNEFYKTKIKEFPLFEQFKFKRPVVNHVIMNGKEVKMIGSIWEFIFSYLSKEQKKILEFGIDCGFGERNSLGFGFINVVK